MLKIIMCKGGDILTGKREKILLKKHRIYTIVKNYGLYEGDDFLCALVKILNIIFEFEK